MAAQRHVIPWQRKRWIIGYAFVFPVIFTFLVFQFYPTIYSFYISFFEWSLMGDHEFIGWENYARALRDDVFHASLRNAFYYALSVPGRMALGLLLALMAFQSVRGKGLLRLMYFTPYITSWVVASIIWKWLFQPDGLINTALGWIGLPGQEWLGSPILAMPAIIVMSIWKTAGFDMMVYLAALTGIPSDLYEVADIDGATPWQRFWYITFPLLRPTTLFLAIIGLISAMQLFTQTYVMTGGGPGRATIAPVQYIYENAFRIYDMGYASALGYLVFLIILVLTLIQFRLFRSND